MIQDLLLRLLFPLSTKYGKALFHRPLEELKAPVLFMGSREDESCRNNMEKEYQEMASKCSRSSVFLFPSGGHPSLFSNAEQSAALIKKFINQYIAE